MSEIVVICNVVIAVSWLTGWLCTMTLCFSFIEDHEMDEPEVGSLVVAIAIMSLFLWPLTGITKVAMMSAKRFRDSGKNPWNPQDKDPYYLGGYIPKVKEEDTPDFYHEGNLDTENPPLDIVYPEQVEIFKKCRESCLFKKPSAFSPFPICEHYDNMSSTCCFEKCPVFKRYWGENYEKT